jgi:hypothetical protein
MFLIREEAQLVKKIQYLSFLALPLLLASCQKQALDEKHPIKILHVQEKASAYPPQDAKSIKIEGKHKPYDRMTQEEFGNYVHNRVVRLDSPDIASNRQGNPYEVVKYMLVSASKRQEKKCLSCFAIVNKKDWQDEKALVEYDFLVTKLYHRKYHFVIYPQEYATGKTYVNPQEFTGTKTYSIDIKLCDDDLTSKTYDLIRKHGRWLIKSIETGLG